ncbi:glycosyltransferase family 2 protein [Mucilaginibacter sp.]|jgi:glycosyltransferase involved in cell wall biosynthesis|uniref:glycosyltransferase family 2 protein n=1 Tax=Mucilaginibacter sp. TaxID=1882438 RepID=UPI00356498E1
MKKNNITTSLIISTYNWPQALNVCLLSVKSQKVLPDEVLVADDGSTEETRLLVEHFQKDFPVPLIHVWQPDEGFQLSRIRNKAIAAASKEYIIQIDGDLILHPMFIADHSAFAKKGTFVSGSRVMLGKSYSAHILQTGKTNVSLFNKEVTNKLNGYRSAFLRGYLSERYKIDDILYLRGCNMAFWRADLIKVNGYNEEFIGWGREDNEVAVRLIYSGIAKRIIKFGGIVYHNYHPEKSRTGLSQNDIMFNKALEQKKTWCDAGLNQYL